MSLKTPTKAALLLLTTVHVLACTDDAVSPQPDPNEQVTIELVPVVSGLAYPIFATAPLADADRLFVVERGGLIRIVVNGAALPTPFLDVGSSIASGGERGLLGMAFHPDYATNGYFYLNYTDTLGTTQVVRYAVSGNPDVADGSSEASILSVPQPATNHNGGMLAFGSDGMLYIGLGDGGGSGDQQNHGQRPSTPLGSMLRIDVDGASPYAIPPDNPFANHATYRGETWAYGLRNPWRFSFDRMNGDLYIGDVGQGQVEEVSYQPASSSGGENYGWRILEGSACYNPSSGCDTAGLTLPVYEYGHNPECSVTGGYVYRGSAFPSLAGRYFFADYCAGWIRSFQIVGGAAGGVQDHTPDIGTLSQISSFGEDGVGELYVVSLGGSVYRITAVDPAP